MTLTTTVTDGPCPLFFFVVVVVVVYASETVLSELRTGHNSRNGDSSIAGAFFFFCRGKVSNDCAKQTQFGEAM